MSKYLLWIFIVFLSIKIDGQQMKLNIIPFPQKVNFTDKAELNLANINELIITSTSDKDLLKSIAPLRKSFESTYGVKLRLSKTPTQSYLINVELVDGFDRLESIPDNQDDEAYIIEINSNGINISAKTPRGVFYACNSVIQMIENSENSLLPSCKVVDWPDMRFRGISDDISRGQVSTLENFKRIIRFISRYKMNTYMPYLEDMIEFEAYPTIGENRGALSKNEIIELVKYADEHFVEVIPIFQTLGHFENILSQSEFIKYADWPGAASLDVTNEQTYEFLEVLLKEVFELFPSKYFHMGADESYDVGFGNSKELTEKTSLAEVHAIHYKRIYDICREYNKEVMMYGDIIIAHPEILEQIPEDITIVDWHYRPRFDYPSTKLFNDAGFNYIVSPSVWNFNSTFPENFLAVPNIKTLTEAGIKNNSIGMINSSWGDYGAESFRELNLYGYAWSAQCAWSINHSKSTDFSNKFFLDFYGTTNKEIAVIYQDLAEPTSQVNWNSFWRHPLLDFRKPDWREYAFPLPSKINWMENNSNKFEVIEGSITKNKAHIDLIKYAVKLKNYFKLKIESQLIINDLFSLPNKESKKALEIIDENISELNELMSEFSTNWLKYNKPANLWMIEDKFDRLITYFNEIKLKIKNNNFDSALIKSDCIYFPSDDDSPIINAKFKKIINIDDDIENAYIQLIADGHAKLHINNNFVDEVYVKRSGSLWLEQQRVKLIDIKEHLNIGQNVIEISVRNYKNKNACCNVISQIMTTNDTIKILSNDEWLAKTDMNNNWINAKIDLNKKIEIIEPNFTTLRKSWIER